MSAVKEVAHHLRNTVAVCSFVLYTTRVLESGVEPRGGGTLGERHKW